jgi:hypothetical protein
MSINSVASTVVLRAKHVRYHFYSNHNGVYRKTGNQHEQITIDTTIFTTNEYILSTNSTYCFGSRGRSYALATGDNFVNLVTHFRVI